MPGRHGIRLISFLENCSRPEFDWLSRVLVGEIQQACASARRRIVSNGDLKSLDDLLDARKQENGGRERQCISTFAGIGSQGPALYGKMQTELDINKTRVDVDERVICCESSSNMDEICLSLAIGTFLEQLKQLARSPLTETAKTFRTRLRLTALKLEAKIRNSLDENFSILQVEQPSSSSPLLIKDSFENARVYHKSAKTKLPPNEQAQRVISLVMPAAGRSSRFPGMKPKWQLTQPPGRLMFVDAMSGLDLSRVKSVHVGLLAEHVDNFCGGDVEAIFNCFAAGVPALDFVDLSIAVIPHETRDQVETLEWIINACQIEGPIVIKDCDNDFVCPLEPVDGIAILEITRENEDIVYNVASKAFVGLSPDQNAITSIVEKRIISPFICIGAYSFADTKKALEMIKTCRTLLEEADSDAELAVSDVFWAKLLNGDQIQPLLASHYQDWGTLAAWQRYCSSFKTLFVDIDGTLVRNSGEYFAPRWGSTPALPENVAHLRKLHKTGRVKIILTTSRTEAVRDATLKQLAAADCPFDQIIFGLQHSQRVVVNDYAPTNPFPSAQAVNLVRNSETLAAMLPL